MRRLDGRAETVKLQNCFLFHRLDLSTSPRDMEQAVYEKPRHDIFIPDDARLAPNSSRRRRAQTPSEAYLDPASMFRPAPVGSDRLMANVSAKLRMRAARAKLKLKARTTLPKLTKTVSGALQKKDKSKPS